MDLTSETDFSLSFLETLIPFQEDFILDVKQQYDNFDKKNKIVKYIKDHQFLGDSLKREQIIGKEKFKIGDEKEYDKFFSEILNKLPIKIDFDGKKYLKEAWETLIFIFSNPNLKGEPINYLIVFQRKFNSLIDVAFVFLKDIGVIPEVKNLFVTLSNNNLNNFLKGFQIINQPKTFITQAQNNLLIAYLTLNVYKLLHDIFISPEDFIFPDFK